MSIQTKLVVYTTFMVLGVALALTWWFTAHQLGSIRDIYVRRADTLVHTLIINLEDDLYALRLHRLRLALAGLRRDEEVVHALVLDAAGNILTDGSMENPQRGKVPHDIIARQLVDSQEDGHRVVDGKLYVITC